jgi:hypothetical protein
VGVCAWKGGVIRKIRTRPYEAGDGTGGRVAAGLGCAPIGIRIRGWVRQTLSLRHGRPRVNPRVKRPGTAMTGRESGTPSQHFPPLTALS